MEQERSHQSINTNLIKIIAKATCHNRNNPDVTPINREMRWFSANTPNSEQGF